ncbi:MAG: M16 family metallopeptidase [Bdellovibrionales bacterium]
MRKNILKVVLASSLLIVLGCQTGPKPFKTNLRSKKLQNGIEVLSFKDKSLPFFQIVLWSPKGSTYEPKDQQGVTELMASLLVEGSENYTKEEISQKFTNLGSAFVAGASDDQVVFSTHGLTQDSLAIARLFTEVVLSPKFENQAILNLKNKKVAGIRAIEDNPSGLASLAFSQLMYQDHGYSRLAGGSLDTLPGIRRDAVVKRYEQIMETRGLKIAFVGNWSEGAEAFVLSRLTDLEKGVEEAGLDRVEIAEKTKEAVLYHKGDLKQANVALGFSAIPRSSTDYEALKVGLSVLGGSFKSRLNQELRIKRGLTYGVGARALAQHDGGVIKISGGVRHDKVYEFIREAKKIIADTAANGITQEELDKTKAIIRGQFPRGVETKEKEAAAYLALESTGVEGRELYVYLNKVLALNLTQVNDALRKYLVMGRMNTLILANRYKIPKKDLKRLRVKTKSFSKIRL